MMAPVVYVEDLVDMIKRPAHQNVVEISETIALMRQTKIATEEAEQKRPTTKKG